MVNAKNKGQKASMDQDESSASLSSYDSSDGEEAEAREEPNDIYFFGTELSSDAREHVWNYSGMKLGERVVESENQADIDPDDTDALRHVLYLRQMVLGKGAKPGERNLVEIEAAAVNGDLVNYLIGSLSIGVQEMAQLQLDFDARIPITIRLAEGSGPVVITGMHEVSLQYETEGTQELSLNETAETEELSEEEVEATERQARKRKLVADDKKNKNKKSRNEASSGDSAGEEAVSPGEEEDEENSQEEMEKKPAVVKKKITPKTKRSGHVKSPRQVAMEKSKARAQTAKKAKKMAA